jgi:hypothetical protein
MESSRTVYRSTQECNVNPVPCSVSKNAFILPAWLKKWTILKSNHRASVHDTAVRGELSSSGKKKYFTMNLHILIFCPIILYMTELFPFLYAYTNITVIIGEISFKIY